MNYCMIIFYLIIDILVYLFGIYYTSSDNTYIRNQQVLKSDSTHKSIKYKLRMKFFSCHTFLCHCCQINILNHIIHIKPAKKKSSQVSYKIQFNCYIFFDLIKTIIEIILITQQFGYLLSSFIFLRPRKKCAELSHIKQKKKSRKGESLALKDQLFCGLFFILKEAKPFQ